MQEVNVFEDKNVNETKKSQLNYEKKKIIVLDPGHGMNNRKQGVYDLGAVVGGVYEAEIVLNQANKIKDILENKDYEVYLTRTNDAK